MLRPEQPSEVLKETLALLKTEFENRRIAVSVDIPDAMPTVQLDRSQVKQVFFNLIKNALEAMPDGGSLKITLGAGDVYVDIAFIDTGKGIAPEEMRRVFDPYHTHGLAGHASPILPAAEPAQARAGLQQLGQRLRGRQIADALEQEGVQEGSAARRGEEPAEPRDLQQVQEFPHLPAQFADFLLDRWKEFRLYAIVRRV